MNWEQARKALFEGATMREKVSGFCDAARADFKIINGKIHRRFLDRVPCRDWAVCEFFYKPSTRKSTFVKLVPKVKAVKYPRWVKYDAVGCFYRFDTDTSRNVDALHPNPFSGAWVVLSRCSTGSFDELTKVSGMTEVPQSEVEAALAAKGYKLVDGVPVKV